ACARAFRLVTSGHVRKKRVLRARRSVGENAVGLVRQRAFVRDETRGLLTCLREQGAVGDEAGEAEVGEPGLACAEQLAGAPELQILLGQIEAVRRVDERLQPL